MSAMSVGGARVLVTQHGLGEDGFYVEAYKSKPEAAESLLRQSIQWLDLDGSRARIRDIAARLIAEIDEEEASATRPSEDTER